MQDCSALSIGIMHFNNGLINKPEPTAYIPKSKPVTLFSSDKFSQMKQDKNIMALEISRF